MALSAIEFVGLLPIVVAVYWLLRHRRLQTLYLSVVTALFVAFSDRFHLWVLLVVLGGTTLIIAAANQATHRRSVLAFGVVALLAVLCIFKYLNWFATLLSWTMPPIAQPLGISYYTFILIGFLLDTAHGRVRLPAGRLPALMLFFPFLLSGPIVRLRSWSNQMSHRPKRRIMRNVTIGSQLFLSGAFKKILIADTIAVSTAPVWAAPLDYSRIAIVMAIFGFYVQLYADFAGYTDMARGVSRMIGFHLPINFKGPYLAATPLEFWGRWHMSLTGWIRDYVFTPLSAATWRRVRSRAWAPYVTFVQVVVLMTLVGLWHGASNNFLFFGMAHGILIGVWYAAVGSGRRLSQSQRAFSWALFQILLIVSMTMFRADTMSSAFEVVKGSLWSAGTESLNDALLGLIVAAGTVFLMQRIELQPGRLLARLRADLRLFPVFVVAIILVFYMKGLTLEGVWISPGDPFFNRGLEKFIYLQF